MGFELGFRLSSLRFDSQRFSSSDGQNTDKSPGSAGKPFLSVATLSSIE
jgi:hypothetical protein